ncbi:MAG: MerR family transcriptional regulator [Sedimenticola sp.]|nr:MAG: MerR family transcriptional regulator [Sedimenticola sp.]
MYSADQLEKLMLIRQLVDQGSRPGKLIKLEVGELRALQNKPRYHFEETVFLGLLKNDNAVTLHAWMQQQLLALGLRKFIHLVMVPAIKVVGDNWATGEVEIYEEHLFTEMMKSVVRQALAETYRSGGKPRVMLTTVPGEQHSLGLLMVEALLRLGGAEVIAFGTEMPFQDIREAAEAHAVDVISLSFSASFKTEDAIVTLSGLRQVIPNEIMIWVGGSAFASRPGVPEGVVLIEGLDAVERALI